MKTETAHDPLLGTHAPRRPKSLAIVAVFLVGALLRFCYITPGGYIQPDEIIVVRVVEHMNLTGDWDSNWNMADLPAHFKYDQYNFSSYQFFALVVRDIVWSLPFIHHPRSEDENLMLYRACSAFLSSLAIILTWKIGKKLGGELVGILAAVLVAVAPLLVQDAHYARPEAFLTVLTLSLVILSWPQPRPFSYIRIAIGGMCCGLMIACKISMVFVAWIPLVGLCSGLNGDGLWPSVRRIAGFGLFTVLGFLLGVPHFILSPEVFFRGLSALSAQYTHLHPPHSHMDGSAVWDFTALYFAKTLGVPVFLFFLLGVFELYRRRSWAQAAILLGPQILSAAVFMHYSVFFERNLSHVVPLFLIIAALGAISSMVSFFSWSHNRLASVPFSLGVLLMLLVTPAGMTARLDAIEFSGRRHREISDYTRSLLARYPGIEFVHGNPLTNDYLIELGEKTASSKGPILLALIDYGGEWSVRYRPMLNQEFDVEVIKHFPSTFKGVPICTLRTYLSPDEDFILVRARN